MNRSFRALALLLVGSSVAMAQGGTSPLLPPSANFRGTSFEDWNVLSAEWTIATGLGGQTLPDTVKKVRFLSGAFSPGEYEFDVEIKPGTGLVFPAFFVFGELYDDGTQDDPVALADLIQFVYDTTFIEVRFDGRVIQSGSGSELVDYQYGVTDFANPIFYEEPQPRGDDLNAVAALWTFGIGAVYHPLSVGTHRIDATVDSLFFGTFIYHYNITVKPPGKK